MTCPFYPPTLREIIGGQPEILCCVLSKSKLGFTQLSDCSDRVSFSVELNPASEHISLPMQLHNLLHCFCPHRDCFLQAGLSLFFQERWNSELAREFHLDLGKQAQPPFAFLDICHKFQQLFSVNFQVFLKGNLAFLLFFYARFQVLNLKQEKEKCTLIAPVRWMKLKRSKRTVSMRTQTPLWHCPRVK